MATFEQGRARRERLGITTDDLIHATTAREVLTYDGESFDVTNVTHRRWVTFDYVLRDAGGYRDLVKGARRIRVIRVAIHSHDFVVRQEAI